MTAQAFQPSLLAAEEPAGYDAAFSGVVRHDLPVDDGEPHPAWVEHAPGWVRGADGLYERVLGVADWHDESIVIHGERRRMPRKLDRWAVDDLPPELGLLREIADVLSERYGAAFASVGCNWYRDGRDSVAWHGDRVARERPTATIAIVSLGERRPFKLRPKGGGASLGFRLGRGDLLVMGGSCQRTWDHGVPKVTRAGPRISVTFRHSY